MPVLTLCSVWSGSSTAVRRTQWHESCRHAAGTTLPQAFWRHCAAGVAGEPATRRLLGSRRSSNAVAHSHRRGVAAKHGSDLRRPSPGLRRAQGRERRGGTVSTHPSRAYRDARTLAPRRPRKRSALSATILRLRVARPSRFARQRAGTRSRSGQPAGSLRCGPAQLERPRHRRTLARTLRRVVDEATGPRPAARANRRRDRSQADPRPRRRRARTGRPPRLPVPRTPRRE